MLLKREIIKEYISNDWRRCFKETQDEKLILRKDNNKSFLRMDAMNATTFKHLLEDTLKEHNLFNLQHSYTMKMN